MPMNKDQSDRGSGTPGEHSGWYAQPLMLLVLILLVLILLVLVLLVLVLLILVLLVLMG